MEEKMTENLTLADAILMGSSVVKPKAGVQIASTEGPQEGCALGMANIAKGVTYRNPTPSEHYQELLYGQRKRSQGTADVWGQWVKQIVARPCECREKTQAEISRDTRPMLEATLGPRWVFKLLDPKMEIQDIIPHLFDVHVMQTADVPLWTLEQLADWVKSVEGPAREKQQQQEMVEFQEAIRRAAEAAFPTTYSPQMSRLLFGLRPRFGVYAYYASVDPVSGGIKPGDDIDTSIQLPKQVGAVQNLDGSVTLEPIPNENPYMKDPFAGMASNSRPEDLNWKTSEITLKNIQKMMELLK